MKEQPNIVLFVADQMRSDSLHHLGNEAAITPNLDRLATEGVSYRNAYCQNPVCAPSRCSFLSGLYPHTTGHRTMHYLQRADEPNILREFKENGYEVIWVGRNDVIPAGRHKTEYCDEYYDGRSGENKAAQTIDGQDGHQKGAYPKPKLSRPEYMQDTGVYSFYMGKPEGGNFMAGIDCRSLESAVAYLERRQEAKTQKPFLLYVTLLFPHPPYICTEPWYSEIRRGQLPPRRPDVETLPGKPRMLAGIRKKQGLTGWTPQQYDEVRTAYLSMVAHFDHQFGQLRTALEKGGEYDNTDIFVFSDHGDYTGDYGIVEKTQNCFEDPVCNVPLLYKPAARQNVQPRISQALVELNDLPATMAERAGFELGYTQFGKSLVHTLASEQEHHDAVFCEGGRLLGEEQAAEGGHGPDSMYWPRLSTQEQEDGSHTKAAMIRMGSYKYVMRLYENDEFYNLAEDPQEAQNRIDDPGYAAQVQRMKNRMLEWYMQTADYVPKKTDKR